MPQTRSRNRSQLSLHFRVRPVLMRWLVCAVSLALTRLLVPHEYFPGATVGEGIVAWVVVSAVFGLLITFVKPLVQLLLLPLIFVSYGLVLVLINTIVIWLLSAIFPNWYQVDNFLWALAAGLVSGVLVVVFENLLGMTPPIVVGQTEAMRIRLARTPVVVEGELLDAAVTGKHKLKRIVGKGDEGGAGKDDEGGDADGGGDP